MAIKYALYMRQRGVHLGERLFKYLVTAIVCYLIVFMNPVSVGTRPGANGKSGME